MEARALVQARHPESRTARIAREVARLVRAPEAVVNRMKREDARYSADILELAPEDRHAEMAMWRMARIAMMEMYETTTDAVPIVFMKDLRELWRHSAETPGLNRANRASEGLAACGLLVAIKSCA